MTEFQREVRRHYRTPDEIAQESLAQSPVGRLRCSIASGYSGGRAKRITVMKKGYVPAAGVVSGHVRPAMAIAGLVAAVALGLFIVGVACSRESPALAMTAFLTIPAALQSARALMPARSD